MNAGRVLPSACPRRRALALLVGGLGVIAGLAGPAGAAPQAFRLETSVYVFRQGDFSSVTLSGADGPKLPESSLIKSPAMVRFDGETLALNGVDFAWSSGRRPTDRISQIEIPALVVAAGQPATLLSVTPLQYMEARPDGALEVKEIPRDSPEAPHARLTFTVKPADAAGPMLDVTCDVEVATVSGRAKLPGVSLAVGKPVLARLARKIDAPVEPNRWSCLLVNAPNGSDYSLLLLFKVTPEPANPIAGAGPMTPAELDAFTTHYYQHPQPELMGRAIAGLGAPGFLTDRKNVFIGFVAEVFAANPSQVEGWRQIASRQPQDVQDVVKAALDLDGPVEVFARKYESVAQNDRCWGAFFASGNPDHLRRLAARMHLIGEADGAKFWIGATAMWSLARNVSEHPAVRITLAAYRPDADGITRGLIDRVLDGKPEETRTWLTGLWKARTTPADKPGQILVNGVPGGGERSFQSSETAPSPSQMGPAFGPKP